MNLTQEFIVISLEERIENNKWLVFTLILVVFTALRIVDSYFRPFWFDELFTLHIAQIPTLAGLWETLGPMDPSPPLYYIITRIFQFFFGYGEFATRLPALISFLIALFFLFLILDRRCGAITAITGVLLLCLSPAAEKLITNARTYPLILACCTISLWCWQVAADNTRRTLPLFGLFLSLCLALYSHFYAFPLFVPIVAGEIYRSFKIRRIDWPIWLTLLLAASTIIPLVPLAERCTSLSAHFWSKPNSLNFLKCSQLYAAQIKVVLIAFVISIFVKYLRKKSNHGQSTQSEIITKQLPPGHEVVAAIGLTLIPFLGYIIAVYFTNAFTTRYFVSATVGAVIILAYSRQLIKRPWIAEGTALLVITAILCLASQANLILSAMEKDRNLRSIIKIMSKSRDELPIVILSPLSYLQTQHYAPESLKNRLFYLIDYDLKFQYSENSPDVSLDGLAELVPIKVESFKLFLNTHKTFYIAGGNSPYMLNSKTIVAPSTETTIIDTEKGPEKYLHKVSVN